MGHRQCLSATSQPIMRGTSPGMMESVRNLGDRRVRPGDDAPAARHFIVGMTKSAPARMPVGQREVMVLRRV